MEAPSPPSESPGRIPFWSAAILVALLAALPHLMGAAFAVADRGSVDAYDPLRTDRSVTILDERYYLSIAKRTEPSHFPFGDGSDGILERRGQNDPRFGLPFHITHFLLLIVDARLASALLDILFAVASFLASYVVVRDWVGSRTAALVGALYSVFLHTFDPVRTVPTLLVRWVTGGDVGSYVSANWLFTTPDSPWPGHYLLRFPYAGAYAWAIPFCLSEAGRFFGAVPGQWSAPRWGALLVFLVLTNFYAGAASLVVAWLVLAIHWRRAGQSKWRCAAALTLPSMLGVWQALSLLAGQREMLRANPAVETHLVRSGIDFSILAACAWAAVMGVAATRGRTRLLLLVHVVPVVLGSHAHLITGGAQWEPRHWVDSYLSLVAAVFVVLLASRIGAWFSRSGVRRGAVVLAMLVILPHTVYAILFALDFRSANVAPPDERALVRWLDSREAGEVVMLPDYEINGTALAETDVSTWLPGRFQMVPSAEILFRYEAWERLHGPGLPTTERPGAPEWWHSAERMLDDQRTRRIGEDLPLLPLLHARVCTYVVFREDRPLPTDSPAVAWPVAFRNATYVVRRVPPP